MIRAAAAILLLTTAFGSSGIRVHAQVIYQSAGGSQASAKTKTSHLDRSIAAIDLAIAAVEAGIMDVSVEAMKRASSKGPPVAAVELGGLLSSQPQQRFRSGQQAAPVDAGQLQLAKRFERLSEAWHQHGMDPQIAYEAWKDLVLPPGRPSEAFSYPTGAGLSRTRSYSTFDFDIERPKVEGSAAATLVAWAQRANRCDDLEKAIAQRAAFPGAGETATLVRVILRAHHKCNTDDSQPNDASEETTFDTEAVHTAQTDAKAAETNTADQPASALQTDVFQTLLKNPKPLLVQSNSDLLCGHLWTAIEALGDSSDTRTALLDRVVESLPGTQRWFSNPWLKFLVTQRLNQAIETGDQGQFDDTARIAMSTYDGIRANNVDYVASLESSFHMRAAERAFKADQTELAANCLRKSASFATTNRSGRNSVLDNYVIKKALLAMPVKERYPLIRDLILKDPHLGLNRSVKLKPTAKLSPLFLAAGERAKSETLQRISSEDSATVSLLEWVARDAISLGKEADVLTEIKQLEERGSDDAPLARLVLDLAKSQPVDLKPFETNSDDGDATYEPAVRANSVSPIDFEILHQGFRQDPSRAEQRFSELLKTCRDTNQTRYLSALSKLKYDVDSGRGESTVTHHALKHWLVSNEYSPSDVHINVHPADAVWRKRDNNAWGHEFSSRMSYLLCRYPIAGDYSVTFRVNDGSYGEIATTSHGLGIEFLKYVDQLWFWGVGQRNQIKEDVQGLEKANFTDIRLEKNDASVTIHVGDNKGKQTIPLQGDSFPFFGMCCHHYRVSTFDSFQLDGNIQIPRQVSLVSPTLIGWSTTYGRQRLPALRLSKDALPQTTSEPDSNWQVTDDVLESVVPRTEPDESAREKVEPRQEGLIQYLRPLADNETISFEFYFEPGKFSLSPAVGTIAMVLDASAKDIGVHWIMSDRDNNWVDLAGDHRLIDPEAKQLGPVDLKPKAWNAMTIRLDGDVITLSINGQDVYQRGWEPEAGRLFGLFHNPSKYQVRARNLTLQGDWPETLPDDLFQLTEGD